MPIQFHVVKTNEKKMPKAYENKMTHSTLTHFGPKQASLIIMIILVYQSMMDNNRHLQRKCPQKQSFNQLISVDFWSKKEKTVACFISCIYIYFSITPFIIFIVIGNQCTLCLWLFSNGVTKTGSQILTTILILLNHKRRAGR